MLMNLFFMTYLASAMASEQQPDLHPSIKLDIYAYLVEGVAETPQDYSRYIVSRKPPGSETERLYFLPDENAIEL